MKVISCAFNFLNKLKINSTILSCENLTCIISTHRNINIPSNIPPSDNLLPKSGKYFQEKENEYAHKVMENLSVYSNSILKYPLQVEKYALRSQLPSENLNAVDEFIKLTIDNMSRCLSIEDQAVTNVIENVCFSLPQASDEDIKRILHYLCLWPTTHSIETRNFHRLWKMLDRECVRRLKHWDMNEKLLIADYWFYLRLSRISRYNQEKFFHKRFLNMSHEPSHLVFVYGTLKKGEPNHDLIECRTEGEATFVGKAKTMKKWPLVIASRYNIPYLLYCEGRGEYISGEIYKVDDIMLAKLDEFECHPKYYTRLLEEVQVMPENGGEHLRPWIYFLMNFRSELLSLHYLSDYTSKGAHGLEYVSRYKRTGESYYSDVMNI